MLEFSKLVDLFLGFIDEYIIISSYGFLFLVLGEVVLVYIFFNVFFIKETFFIIVVIV